jgi:hypothetical protein
MPGPKPDVPNKISIANVSPGASRTGSGGGIIASSADAVVQINADPFGAFFISSLEIRALTRDPDARPGSPLVWETVSTVNGAGPISVEAGNELVVFAGFACPLQPTQLRYGATATATAAGTTLPVLLSVPLSGTVNQGGVGIQPLFTPPLMAGQTATFKFRLASSLLHEVAGVFTCDPAPGDTSNFRSDTAPQFPTIAAGAVVDLDLAVTCLPGTPEGVYNVLFGLKAIPDPHFLFSARVPLKVMSNRSVRIVTNLLPILSLEQGSGTLCEIRADMVGAPGVFSISPGTVPEGVSLDNGNQSLPIDRSVFVGTTIDVDPQAPLSTTRQVLSVNWEVAADELHNAVTGSQNFNLRIVPPAPAELPFDVDSITFDDHQPAGGDAHLLLRRDGTYKFWGHFHDSGAADINYSVGLTVMDPKGNVYTFAHPGTVHGHLTPGSADDDWAVEGRDDRIAQGWLTLLEGSVVTWAARADTDLGNIILEAVGVLGTVLGAGEFDHYDITDQRDRADGAVDNSAGTGSAGRGIGVRVAGTD